MRPKPWRPPSNPDGWAAKRLARGRAHGNHSRTVSCALGLKLTVRIVMSPANTATCLMIQILGLTPIEGFLHDNVYMQ